MAERFHFNPETGRTGKCSFDPSNPRSRGCRFGQSDGQHGATRDEARANYEQQMESELFSNARSKDAGAQDPSSQDWLPPAAPTTLWSDYINDITDTVEAHLPLDDQSRRKIRWKASHDLPLTMMDGLELKLKGRDLWQRDALKLKIEPNGAVSVEDLSQSGRVDPETIKQLGEDLESYRAQFSTEMQERVIPNSKLENKRFLAIWAKAAPAKESSLKADYNRYSDSELQSEDWGLQEETGYSAAELMRLRNIGEAEIAEAERGDGNLWMKVPGRSETTISVELARKELPNVKRSSSGSIGGGYFF